MRAETTSRGARDEATDVWRTLFLTQQAQLGGWAYPGFWPALSALGISPDREPDLARLSRDLHAGHGWSLECCEGKLPEAEFFKMLAARRFPVIRELRPAHELRYASKPDVWHDLFGHVPSLTHPVLSRVYEAFGRAGVRALAVAPQYLVPLARLYWWTIEFGFVGERGQERIYGAGILPSPGETEHALSPRARRGRFDVATAVARPYQENVLQEAFFAVDSFEALEAEILAWIRTCLS